MINLMQANKQRRIFIVAFFAYFNSYNQVPILTALSIGECADNCTAPNAIVKEEFRKDLYKITFGLFETCHNNDTMIFKVSEDTLKIQFGEKKRMKVKTMNGKEETIFGASAE